ncbi:YihY/virulence factor BrkB family protein [Flavobacterium agricola]|uniref:YihY/virulence factor BrkB family protein n=1 Tax=Flavobacterium agricola TaxID=2870839 RepID=A0ABY6M100_9FLAO|nr:YihY/virulence factor BrkB family protein [Flavobacterium agricola]UYW02174.1 YihY/virulence factor BrkB family protein [Flavobacterium agricola]
MFENKNRKILKYTWVRKAIRFLNSIYFPGLKGLSIYRFFQIYLTGIFRGAFSYRAGSVAFSFFMAMFPFILFILNLLPFVPLEGFQQNFLDFIADNVPPTTFGAIEGVIKDILNNSHRSLISSGFFLSIILMANGINAILGGFQSSYHISQLSSNRSFLRQYFVAVVLSLVISAILIVAVAAIVVTEYFVHHFSESIPIDELYVIQVSRYSILLFLILVVNSLILKFGTKHTKYLPFFNAGSLFSTALMVLGSYGFGIYVTKFARYNEFYGSIGAILVLMIYIWIISIIILLGFEVNASINSYRISKQTTKLDS